jgi:hypothetical protein
MRHLEQFRRDTTTAIEWLKQSQSSTSIISKGEEGTGIWVGRSRPWKTWEAILHSKPLCICGPPGHYDISTIA